MIALFVGIAVIAVIAVIALWPRGATPVDRDTAVSDFRARATTGDSNDATSDGDRPTPAPGVYRFETTGSENVKLGPLPTETRPYPRSVFVSIVDADGHCFTATLNLLQQHTEDTTYCVSESGGLRLESHRKHQQVGAMKPVADMTCDPALLIDPVRPKMPLNCRLSISGGPARLSTTLTGTSSSTRSTTVTVDGAPVDAVAFDLELTLQGDLTGTWHEHVWFARATWLPLRISRELDFRGLATFTERSDSVLTSLKPST